MPKRSITDEEIGLIKAMLARGMANDKVHLYFNHQARPISTGRISNIKMGKYGPEILAADDNALSVFMANYKSPDLAAPAITVQATTPLPTDAMDDKTLRSFFARDAKGVWHCTAGETDEFECKEGFNLRSFSKPLRTIAGYANNRGGYLFFGVKDKPLGFVVCGLADDRFTNTDQNKFSQTIRSVLEPTPRFRVASLKLDALTVGIIYVEPHNAKPVIASKCEGEVAEGTIYYRYPGETRPICYPDLRAILDERDQRSREAILPMVQRLLELGPRNAMIANLADGSLEGGTRPIIIDEQLVQRIKFIRDGEFDEREGAETLRLVGDVNAVDMSSVTTIKTVRAELTEEAIVRNFLGRVAVEEPLAYVRQASHEQSFLLPMFYYLHLEGQTRKGAISELNAHDNAKPNTAKQMILRLKGQRTLFVKAGGDRLIMLDQIRNHSIGEIKSIEQAKSAMGAITGLTAADEDVFDYASELVIQAMEFWAKDRSLVSLLRKAASRLDELIYGPKVPRALVE